MSFQWIVDSATQIGINRLDTVASTQSRDGTVKAVNRGTAKKIFRITLPDGPRWIDIKSDIEGAEALDRHTTATIAIRYDVHPWYYGNVDPGTDETYNVICVQFPQWNVFGSVSSAQVSWDGDFVFVEV